MSSFLSALAVGSLVGIALAPARLSGVDFREWFKDPGELREQEDDTWIGAVRATSHVLFWAIVVTFVVAWTALWYATQACLDWPWREWSLFATCFGDYLSWWARWRIIAGLAVGIVLAQIAAELIWRLGLARARVPAEPLHHLSRSGPVAVTAAGEPSRASGRRRLIVCCDGTWNWPDKRRETNVVRLVRAIRPTADTPGEAPISQIVHYHMGVGTGNILDHWLGGGTGVGLSNNVKQCYGFLADNYRVGDEILLFGFSRGAYVARSVGGLLSLAGIVQKREMAWFIDVWDCYTESPKVLSKDQKLELLDKVAPNRHRPETIDIECIGVWDTVGALGIPGTRLCVEAFGFHETKLGAGVRHAFQALALDERRGNFQPAIWVPHENPYWKRPQVLEQVWFPGVHSNIGGGYVQHGLSDATFLWMMSRLLDRKLLDLDVDYIKNSALDRSEAYPSGELADSRSTFWKLIGSPVPRPVCITHASEWIHASAWDRAALKLPGDVYATDRREGWLRTMADHKALRSDLESGFAVTTATPSPPEPARTSRKLRWCDRLLQALSGAG
jgi:uncharacterized protein (DUF2235 family)